MLLKYARAGTFGGDSEKLPVSEQKRYSWVNNPKKPYESLEEAFDNWSIVGEDVNYYYDTGDLVVQGSYNNKMGQLDFLIEQLAPTLKDTTIEIIGEDGFVECLTVKNHQFLLS